MTQKEKPVVVVKNVIKSFKIPLESSSGIKQKLVNTLKGRKGYRVFTPLDDVSFTINKGDFFGIVGRNGSGKSTLLKTLAGIYSPNGGSVAVDGTLVPFIELGVGFNPELTGRENVFLNGALLGFSRGEMESMYGDIVDFAELSDFMDERLKNYSSGMQVRLAFSIAIRANGDILLLDEVLAVGDEAFQQKCYDYFSSLKKDKKTVILVTHDMGAIEKYCNKAILIEKGKIKEQGTNIDIANAYKQLFIDDRSNNIKTESKTLVDNKSVTIDQVAIIQNNRIVEKVSALEPFTIETTLESPVDIGAGAFGVNVINSTGIIVFATGVGTIYDEPFTIKKGKNKIKITVTDNTFTNDRYSVNIAVAEGDQGDNQRLILQKTGVVNFAVFGIKARTYSIMHPKVIIEVE